MYTSVTRRSGSSPRVRGAGLRPGRDRPLRGIIPACAGSSSRSRPRGTGSWDHPRACGEQALRFFTTLISSGSSPRVRGAALDGEGLAPRLGIIPAYAGSSAGLSSSCPARWDHPRACGEQRPPSWAPLRPAGSSPRMRGADQGRVRQPRRVGIIPAHAGSRWRWTSRTAPSRDHPRACGEQVSA